MKSILGLLLLVTAGYEAVEFTKEERSFIRNFEAPKDKDLKNIPDILPSEQEIINDYLEDSLKNEVKSAGKKKYFSKFFNNIFNRDKDKEVNPDESSALNKFFNKFFNRKKDEDLKPSEINMLDKIFNNILNRGKNEEQESGPSIWDKLFKKIFKKEMNNVEDYLQEYLNGLSEEDKKQFYNKGLLILRNSYNLLTAITKGKNENDRMSLLQGLKYLHKLFGERKGTSKPSEPSTLDKGLALLNKLVGGKTDESNSDLGNFLNQLVNGKTEGKNDTQSEDSSIMDEIKIYLENVLNNNNITYDRFLDNIVNYVQENTHFWLFTKNHKKYQELMMGGSGNISGSNFDSSKPTVILIHGWINSGNNFYSRIMIDAYKAYGDYNIISVDWSALSYSFYTISRISVNFVGPYVAHMIDSLVTNHGVNLEDIHILGHSLGAHVAGIAGFFVRSGKISRITGFDPASPFFGDDNKYRLDKSDAQFVDVIHSSVLGLQDSVGHADFFPNGGGPIQPGCGLNIGACPHRRSYLYFTESMQKQEENFLAYPCASWASFEEGNCTEQPVVMGVDTPTDARGNYYLRTAEESPFSLGKRTLLKPSEPTRAPRKRHYKPPKKFHSQ